jgi:hypothetical protein
MSSTPTIWEFFGNLKTFDAGGRHVEAFMGKRVLAVAADRAWTAGHIGVLGATVAGKIHDNGNTAIPANLPAAETSYVIFLDTGAGAGNSRVLVIRMYCVGGGRRRRQPNNFRLIRRVVLPAQSQALA